MNLVKGVSVYPPTPTALQWFKKNWTLMHFCFFQAQIYLCICIACYLVLVLQIGIHNEVKESPKENEGIESHCMQMSAHLLHP